MNRILALWPLAVILVAYGLDRLSKWWAAAFLAQHGPTDLTSWLSMQIAYNRGIAFGLLQGVGPLVGWLTIIVLLLLAVFMFSLSQEQWVLKLGLAILIGGAAGNMWDRIVHGRVLDFLVSPVRPGIFNIADVLIYVGIGLCLLSAFLPAPVVATLPAEAPLD